MANCLNCGNYTGSQGPIICSRCQLLFCLKSFNENPIGFLFGILVLAGFVAYILFPKAKDSNSDDGHDFNPPTHLTQPVPIDHPSGFGLPPLVPDPTATPIRQSNIESPTLLSDSEIIYKTFKGDLEILTNTIEKERRRWREASDKVKELAESTGASQIGSEVYNELRSAKYTVQEIESKAPSMLAEKARLEAAIKELKQN